MKNKKIKCPNCKSEDVVKRGTFETKVHGKQQRYYCKSCSKKFIERSGFYRMRNSSNKITLCLDLFFKGISTRQIQQHLQAFYPHNSSHKSIYKWVVKYSNLIGNYTDNLKINNSSSITFDEIEYKTKGKQSFFIDVMDMQSRYMLSSGLYFKRTDKELREVLKKSRKKSINETLNFYTDGLHIYKKALKREYFYNKHLKKFNHKVTKSSDKAFNWKIERLHNSIRARTKAFRGFHGSIDSARSIMKGIEINYNFIRKHQGLGKTPSELATNIKLNENNKWLELIKLSC